MHRHHRSIVAGAAVATLFAFPGASAQAAKKSVFAGPPRPVKTAPKGVDLTQFYPKKIKVAQGGSIDFHFRGFHSITFLGKAKLPDFFITDGNKIAEQKDAAGNPFWFNGQNRLLLNPVVGAPAGDAKVDNRALENSGLPQDENQKPHTLKFTKTGTFKYLCLVHPKMRGQVTVLKKGRRVPSTRSDDAAIAKQIAKAVTVAKQKAGFAGEGGTNVRAGNSTADVEVLKFLPDDVSVKAGGSVTWRAPHAHDFHTISFGPETYLKPIGESFIAPDTTAPQGGPPTLVGNPLVLFPSDPPPGVPVYDGANHGNGFLNSGIIDGDSATPNPDRFTAAFSKPGIYNYICLVHGKEMAGKVTVTS